LKEVNKFIRQGRELLAIEEPVEAHSQFGSWHSSVTNWLSLQAPKSGLAEEWKSIGTSVLLIGSRYYNDVASWTIFRNVVRKRIDWLERLEARPSAASVEQSRPVASVKTEKTGKVHVHGPPGPLRDEVTAFLKRLHVPVLQSDPNSMSKDGFPGKGVHFSEIGFTVILFPGRGDEKGGAPGPAVPVRPSSPPILKAVFELGYLIGKVGVKRTCALVAEGTSLPLEPDSVLQIEADAAGAWQIALARGLKRAGIPFDMNLVL
jgi:hypothetical protein